MKISLGGKDPIKPTVEAIESMQRNIDYWGRRCELVEERLEAVKSWLRACLGMVEGSGPPNWDGIREFLKSGKSIKIEDCTFTNAGWQPINTAPYGHVLGWVSFGEGRGSHFIVHKDDADMWCDDNDDQILGHKVTHWMPLPEPPAEK